jgi:hypothetical protein
MGMWSAAADLWQQTSGEHVFTDLGYTPTGRQQEFHDAREFDVLYGGAAGGGKTKGLVMEGLRACVKYPGLTVGAFRRSYPELEESLLTEIRALLGDLSEHYGARYDETKHDLRFPNGSLIRFRHMGNLRDATKRQGGEYQLLLFDERTLTPPDAVDFLYTRLRSGRADLPVLGVRSGTNPGGIGHGRVKADYIDATSHGKHIVTDERGRTRRFIQSRVSDNPHLNPEYAHDLAALPEAMRRAFLEGDWDSFTGQVFTEWRHQLHVVPAFPIPQVWRRVSGIDYGYAAPWAVVWAAIDPDGRVWIYRELSRRGVIERDQAATIVTIETAAKEDLVHHADPAMWARTGEAPSPAQAYQKADVRIVPATNDRLAGWQRLHTYLAPASACALHRAQGLEKCPLLHVFDRCSEVIRTVPALPYDPLRVEDVDTNADDHVPDALRYLLMGVPDRPVLRESHHPRHPEDGSRDLTGDLLNTPL